MSEENKVEVNENVKNFKEFLYKEIDTWKEIFEQFRTEIKNSPDDVHTEVLVRAQNLIRACDREVVYMQQVAQMQQRLEEEKAKEEEKK